MRWPRRGRPDGDAPLAAPQSRAISTLVRVIVGLVVGFMAVVGVGLWRDVVRAKQVSNLTASVRNLTTAQRQRDAEVAQLARLADAYALLASTDPAERAAAREELAALAREAAADRQRSGGAPAATRPPSTSQPPSTAPPTTSAPRPTTTTTTRPCRVQVGPLRVCGR